MLQMKTNRLIALITDFGTSDAFVGAVKGVILGIAPSAVIVDITHEVSPYNTDQAAYLLWSSFRCFPSGTVFVCVVDPGVGTERKVLCVEAGTYVFLAPDNGSLKFVLRASRKARIINVTNKKYFASEMSSTFHGRDIFAHIAAHLSRGVSVTKLGNVTVPDHGEEGFVEIIRKAKGRCRGKILHIDRFGNVVTNFLMRGEALERMDLKIGSNSVRDCFQAYSEARPGTPFMLKGSSSLLEVSVKERSAAKFLRAKLNQDIFLTIR